MPAMCPISMSTAPGSVAFAAFLHLLVEPANSERTVFASGCPWTLPPWGGCGQLNPTETATSGTLGRYHGEPGVPHAMMDRYLPGYGRRRCVWRVGAPSAHGTPAAICRFLRRIPPFSACTARTRTPLGGARTSVVTRSLRRGRSRVLPAATRAIAARS